MSHDHATLEEFVRSLARAPLYHSIDTGYVIGEYWKDEAVAWVKEWDECSAEHTQENGCILTCGKPVVARHPEHNSHGVVNLCAKHEAEHVQLCRAKHCTSKPKTVRQFIQEEES